MGIEHLRSSRVTSPISGGHKHSIDHKMNPARLCELTNEDR